MSNVTNLEPPIFRSSAGQMFTVNCWRYMEIWDNMVSVSKWSICSIYEWTLGNLWHELSNVQPALMPFAKTEMILMNDIMFFILILDGIVVIIAVDELWALNFCLEFFLNPFKKNYISIWIRFATMQRDALDIKVFTLATSTAWRHWR